MAIREPELCWEAKKPMVIHHEKNTSSGAHCSHVGPHPSQMKCFAIVAVASLGILFSCVSIVQQKPNRCRFVADIQTTNNCGDKRGSREALLNLKTQTLKLGGDTMQCC